MERTTGEGRAGPKETGGLGLRPGFQLEQLLRRNSVLIKTRFRAGLNIPLGRFDAPEDSA